MYTSCFTSPPAAIIHTRLGRKHILIATRQNLTLRALHRRGRYSITMPVTGAACASRGCSTDREMPYRPIITLTWYHVQYTTAGLHVYPVVRLYLYLTLNARTKDTATDFNITHTCRYYDRNHKVFIPGAGYIPSTGTSKSQVLLFNSYTTNYLPVFRSKIQQHVTPWRHTIRTMSRYSYHGCGLYGRPAFNE